jgi:predicted dehydrogenase
MKPRIALIGAGNMAAYHITGFRQAGAEVIAVCDTNEVSARKAAALHGIPHSFANPEAMLGSLPEIEAVSILTPNKHHAPLALSALAAGKHVFCEKPPALNAQEMARMKAAAEKAGRVLMFNFNNRARPESYALMDYIRQDAVGRINSAQAVWSRRTGIPGFGGWFTQRAQSGGGALVDLLHMLDLCLYFMDYPEPSWVLAQTFSDFSGDKSFKGPWGIPDAQGGVNDVETAAHGFVRFQTGQVLSFRISWAEMVAREEVSASFQGTKAGGRVKRTFLQDGVDATATDACELFTHENGRPVNRKIIVPPDAAMGRVRSAVNFVRTVDGSEPPLNTPAQALTLMRIIDAAYLSARTGEPVRT